jgi:bifunctional N-acetylglucosamine-1-phosphate-uridyltransferase/glucosamine-1-phosphate-acetyltransferase GlmU-like protein
MTNSIPALVLAAGKGTRLNCENSNKTMLKINNKPLLWYTASILRKAGCAPIYFIVGFASNGIRSYFKDSVQYIEQKEQLGTAHAVSSALKYLPSDTHNILVTNGDDSYLYDPKLIRNLIRHHISGNESLTLLTITVSDPAGLGRVVRNKAGEIISVVEDKDATDSEKQITEINPQCWVFSISFLQKYLPKVPLNELKKEYYLTELVRLAHQNTIKINSLQAGSIPWRGINTWDEYRQANVLKALPMKVS